MTGEDLEALLRRYVAAVWDEGDLSALDRFLSESFRRHVSPRKPSLDRAAQIERLAGIQQAFPDVTITIEDVVAAGDRIAFRSTMRGTHEGELAGIPATGRTIEVGLVDIIRVAGGRFEEQWGGPDMLDLLQQLGATVFPG